jgi:hypothetical protein
MCCSSCRHVLPPCDAPKPYIALAIPIILYFFHFQVFEGGSPAVMCLALAMLRELEPQILACDSISEVMDLVHRCDPSMQPNWESVVIQASIIPLP